MLPAVNTLAHVAAWPPAHALMARRRYSPRQPCWLGAAVHSGCGKFPVVFPAPAALQILGGEGVCGHADGAGTEPAGAAVHGWAGLQRLCPPGAHAHWKLRGLPCQPRHRSATEPQLPRSAAAVGCWSWPAHLLRSAPPVPLSYVPHPRPSAVGMSALLLLYVNWGALQEECLKRDTCDIWEVSGRRSCRRARPHGGALRLLCCASCPPMRPALPTSAMCPPTRRPLGGTLFGAAGGHPPPPAVGPLVRLDPAVGRLPGALLRLLGGRPGKYTENTAETACGGAHATGWLPAWQPWRAGGS